MAEQEIGVVTHYFNHINVAGIKITQGTLKVGDRIRVVGRTSDFNCIVQSLQIEHEEAESAKKGDLVGIEVPEHAREHDKVFKVTD